MDRPSAFYRYSKTDEKNEAILGSVIYYILYYIIYSVGGNQYKIRISDNILLSFPPLSLLSMLTVINILINFIFNFL